MRCGVRCSCDSEDYVHTEGGREGEGGSEEEYLYGGLERGHVAMLLCLLTAIGGCTSTGTDTITGTGTGTDTCIKGRNVECGIWI